MDSLPEPLAELELHGFPELKGLPAALPKFSIPRLEEKPQNPIIGNLERKEVFEPLANVGFEDARTANNAEKHEVVRENVWLEIKDTWNDRKGRLVSWDTLRSSYRIPKSPSPFISEQAPDVPSAARNPAQLLPACAGRKVILITVTELYDVLCSTLVGCASVLYDWNSSEERFVAKNDSEGKVQLLIEGMDEVITDSYMSRFTEFGTLFRRLEMLAIELRKSTRGDSSAIFAFAHCLSSALIWIRHEANCALSSLEGTVCDVMISLQDIHFVLLALASLCSRDVHLDPKSYPSLPQVAQRLLSHIYDFLLSRVESQAPFLVRAVLSYILTVTSRPYFTGLSHSIGLVTLDETLSDARRRPFRTHGDAILSDQDDSGEADSELELENDIKEEFPSFMSEEIRNAVIRSRRSIRILSSPEFEGSQKIDLPEFRMLEWIWTDDEVSNRSMGPKPNALESDPAEICRPTIQLVTREATQKYKPELVELAVFDLEPDSVSQESDRDIVTFISTYPTYPPPLAPTLPLLAEHILAPVLAQANALGRAALRHFLTPGTSLHLRAHLVLLRAYVLLTGPAFKARLVAALFSDADVDEEADDRALENPMGITIRTRAQNANWRAVRRRSADATAHIRNDRPWPVGIAYGLMRQDEWPPGGSDLSFYLRRVIMDSLEGVRESEVMFTDALRKDELGDEEFWDEAESRLGFAIRDLPVGTGNEKWLDPTQIEALDFLYMQYRPPDPLCCLITTDILSKYQRIFAFLLRLLRVETAMRLVFRVIRPCSVELVFPDRPNTQSLVLHFRFAAQAFVSALSAYVMDTAIRGNIDAFIARVRYAEVAAASQHDDHVGPFADVYALMQRHSRVLDAILAACLLRGAQRAVGDILRALLDVILEFSVLVGNAYRSSCTPIQYNTFDEERAAQRIDALYAKFCKTRNALMKALRKIAERGAKPFSAESTTHSREKLPSASGGMEALIDLLLRMGDTNDVKK